MIQKLAIAFGLIVMLGAPIGYYFANQYFQGYQQSLVDYQDKSKAIPVRSALTNWYVSLEMYRAENGKYPLLLSAVEMKPPIDDDITILYESDGDSYLMTASRDDIKIQMNEKKELTKADGSPIK